MEVGDAVIIVRPYKKCHMGKEAVILKKLIDNEGVAIYRVKINGRKNPLPRWATDEDLKLQDNTQ